MNISTGAQSSGQASVEVDRLIRCGCGDPDTHNGIRCRHAADEKCDFCFRPCPIPCGCGDPASHNGQDYPWKRPCPKPRAAGFQGEQLGNVGFTHKSMLVRWADWLLRSTGHSYTLWVAPNWVKRIATMHTHTRPFDASGRLPVEIREISSESFRKHLRGKPLRAKLALYLIALSGHRLVEFWFSESADADTIRRGTN